MVYTTAHFWKQATERAVKTAVQAVIGALVLSDTGPVNAFELDYQLAGGVFLGGAFLSYLTSLASAPVGEKNDPSAV